MEEIQVRKKLIIGFLDMGDYMEPILADYSEELAQKLKQQKKENEKRKESLK